MFGFAMTVKVLFVPEGSIAYAHCASEWWEVLLEMRATFVSSLNAEQLEIIAGEDQGTRRTRSHLKKGIASLEDAKKILK
jgi:hypothetical protein